MGTETVESSHDLSNSKQFSDTDKCPAIQQVVEISEGIKECRPLRDHFAQLPWRDFRGLIRCPSEVILLKLVRLLPLLPGKQSSCNNLLSGKAWALLELAYPVPSLVVLAEKQLSTPAWCSIWLSTPSLHPRKLVTKPERGLHFGSPHLPLGLGTDWRDSLSFVQTPQLFRNKQY